MASIEYSEIFSRFYLRVQDYKFGSLAEDTAKEMLKGYLRQVISKPFVRKLFSSISADDDIEEIEFTMREPQDEAADIDFAEEVLALGMMGAWVEPQYHSTVNTAQLFSNSEQKFYSQSAHLAELKNMYEKSQTDLRKLIRDRGYVNSYINGVS